MSEKKKKLSGRADDMFLAFIITYTLAAFSFEKYMPEGFMRIFNFAVFIAFAAVWMGLSFKSGRRNGRAFPIFAAAFWIVPQIIIGLAENGPEFMRMSIIMYLLSEFCMLITTVPSELIGAFTGISVPAAIAVILILCAAAYMGGMLVRIRREPKR